MDVTQLKYFRAVAEAGSFTRAALNLHMTQSALSKAIAKLEDEIGLRLFEREGNRITLNRFGQRFLQDSQAVLRGYSDCVRAVREMAGLEFGDVRIGISRDVFIDHLIRQFLIDYPQATLHCYLLSPEQMRDALENGDVDYVITTQPPTGIDIRRQVLYTDQLEAMLAASHPLAREKQLHLEQLQNERFIVTNSNYNMENFINQLCNYAGFEPKVLYEGTSTDMPMYFIAAGQAVMITPHSITAGVAQSILFNPEIVRIPLINEFPGMQKDLLAVFHENHYQSAAARIFYDKMLDFFAHIDDLG